MWYIILLLIVSLIAAVLGLGGGLINYLSKHANVQDTQYFPLDVDRSTLEKPKHALDQKQSKP